MCKLGDVTLSRDNQPVTDSNFIKEAGGFMYFGEASLDALVRSPYTVRVSSEVAHVLALRRRQLDSFLGAVGSGLASRDAVAAALRKCKSLQVRQLLPALTVQCAACVPGSRQFVY